jgi:hypothetical protein
MKHMLEDSNLADIEKSVVLFALMYDYFLVSL